MGAHLRRESVRTMTQETPHKNNASPQEHNQPTNDDPKPQVSRVHRMTRIWNNREIRSAADSRTPPTTPAPSHARNTTGAQIPMPQMLPQRKLPPATTSPTNKKQSIFKRKKPYQSPSPSSSTPHTSFAVIHSGYLTKEGAVFHSWKRRFFVLRENKVLYYHPNSKSTNFKGQILLQNTLIKKIENNAYKGKENCFQIYSKEFSRTYYMFADSAQEMDVWIKKLRLVTYGHNESLSRWLVLGQHGCGKSSLIRRWHTGVFDKNVPPTTESLHKTMCKTTTDEGAVIEIELLEASDTNTSIDSLHELDALKNLACIVLVFDLTSRQSWNTIKSWVPSLKRHFPERLFIILATKMDLHYERCIPSIVAQLFASKMNVDYMEATATSNAGDYSFSFVVDQLERRGKIEN